ncbi:sigma-70 family RNA polymerase sigma factor [Nordella sp. HKS 07]|uniref:sigma-70 family RNA polymerase sigma factor n=1 Tax=Nordella sp. HKS 07 TaxID=2712222 RepID=UPI0013E19795|nr:sigma-70 family RNA polymerase sigma factor [Nordella sp. HKS 07]QIG52013.1 sigma-70 family RNA polymerase sigma factor [Nordella sp. HKS 07]
MMTRARIAHSIGANDWLFPPIWQRLPRQTRPSFSKRLFEGAVLLFHLMAAAKEDSQQAAAGAVARSELTQRFHDVIVPHLDAAYNFARFLSRDADASQDIVQEAFLRAYRSFDTYQGGDPRAWLFAIVRNCCHVWRQTDRRKARFEQHMGDGGGSDADDAGDYEIASEEDTPETATIRRREQERVRAVIGGLPEPMREILVLRELEDLSYREIAEIIEAPIGTVMSRLARARREFGEAWGACSQSEVAR